MKRKYFSALLMGALTIASVSTFTSCKDYDDDISNLQQQIDSNAKAIETIQNLIKGGGLVTLPLVLESVATPLLLPHLSSTSPLILSIVVQ